MIWLAYHFTAFNRLVVVFEDICSFSHYDLFMVDVIDDNNLSLHSESFNFRKKRWRKLLTNHKNSDFQIRTFVALMVYAIVSVHLSSYRRNSNACKHMQWAQLRTLSLLRAENLWSKWCVWQANDVRRTSTDSNWFISRFDWMIVVIY